MRWLLFLLCLSSPLGAQTQTASTRDTVYIFPINYLAVTACDRKGFVRSYGDLELPDSLLVLIRVHEAKHREQSKRYPSCKAWENATAHNAHLAAEYEVEAYVAALRKARQLTMDVDILRSEYIHKVFQQFWGAVPLHTITEWFAKYEAS